MRIAIIGAGFAGLAASLNLRGEVHVFEEHKKVGFPKHCTGLVSNRVVEWLGKIGYDNVVGWIDTFVFLNEKGESFLIRGKNKFTAVLDRVNLERDMMESSTASFHLGRRIKRITQEGKVDGVSFDYVILAEGWKASLASQLGMRNRARRMLGINTTLRPVERGVTYVFFIRGWGDSFGWIVNAEEEARVGVATVAYNKVREMLNYIIKVGLKRKLIKGEAKELYGGIVQVGPPLLKPYKGRVFLLGDVAGLNKPLTGGGLYPTLEVVRRWRRGPSKKAYHPTVERLSLETPLGFFIRRTGSKLISMIKGREFEVSEFDNHLKTSLSLMLQLLGLT